MKIHRVVERTRGGTVDVRLTAHVNNSMQPVEGSTAAIRDDLRQVYAAWHWTGREFTDLFCTRWIVHAHHCASMYVDFSVLLVLETIQAF